MSVFAPGVTGELGETTPDVEAIRWHAWQAYEPATFDGLGAEAERVEARQSERRAQHARQVEFALTKERAERRRLQAERRAAEHVRLLELQAQAAADLEDEEAAMLLLLL